MFEAPPSANVERRTRRLELTRGTEGATRDEFLQVRRFVTEVDGSVLGCGEVPHRLRILINVHNPILSRHLCYSGEILAMSDRKSSAFTATDGCNLRRRAPPASLNKPLLLQRLKRTPDHYRTQSILVVLRLAVCRGGNH